MKEIFTVKGMHDILPNESFYWNMIEKIWHNTIKTYCYKEIRTPIVENLDLFYSSIGKETDIVSKEIFSFLDKNKVELGLRPEGTASCARLIINNNLLYNGTQRVWYKGNMFRYEIPQKGRYRQFNQIGIEAFGFKDIDIEMEQIFIINRFFKNIFLDNIILEINSIGSLSTRIKYKEELLKYLNKYKNSFNEMIRNQLEKNPLRILDSKEKKIINILKDGPIISKFYTKEEKERIYQIELFLKDKNINYKKNPYLVRGLDYYNDFVFEYKASKLGSQSAICAGGRYDNVVNKSSKGRLNTHCFGCARGLERILLILDKDKFTIKTMSVKPAFTDFIY
jgi:histidyl-tRNA synthetase